MGFLVPAFLAGALAIGVPIWVHLTNKQRKEAIEFPSLMFLEKIPFRSEKKQVLRNVLLFAMRVLALILLIMAFSRPFLGKVTRPPAGLGAAREVAILLDRSYSMGYGDRWQKAVEAANSAVEGLGGNDQATIILFDSEAEATGEPSADKAALKAFISTAKLTDKGTKYDPAIKLAEKILNESEQPKLEVILISDFQKVAWEGHEEVQLPDGTEIKTVDVSVSDTTANLAVTNVNLRRERQEGRDRVTASARITNGGIAEKKGVAVSLSLNGRVVETKRVDVPPSNAVNATFTSVAVPEGTTKGTISIEKDSLEADNNFNFIISGDHEVGVLIIEDETPVDYQSFFLRNALEIGDNPNFRVDVKSASRTTFGDLDRRALVIINDAPFPGGDLGKRLKEFVSKGGGLFIVIGDQSNSAGWVGDGAELLPGKVSSVIQRNPGNGAALASLDFGHPIFELFSVPRSGDFSGARFFNYRSITPKDSTKTLAHFDDGSVAMVEGQHGKGRVLVFGAALDGAEIHTDLPRHVVFLPFIHEIAKHVASFADARPWFNVGEVLDVVKQAQPTGAAAVRATEAELTAADIALIAPSGDPVAADSGAQTGFLELDEKGFYELRRAGGRTETVPVAVNLEVAESNLSRFEPKDLVTSALNRTSDGAGSGNPRNLTAVQKEKRQNLWWYMLVVALLLFAGETLLGNRLSPALRTRAS